MAKQMTEEELRRKAVDVLTKSLGPVDSLRFLASVSRESFDYQSWRHQYFSHFSVDELVDEADGSRSTKS